MESEFSLDRPSIVVSTMLPSSSSSGTAFAIAVFTEWCMTMLEDELQELKGLPARVDAVELQIVLLRDDVTAIGHEVREGFTRVDARFAQVDKRLDQVYGRIETGESEMRDFVREMGEGLMKQIAEVRTHALVLHEELVSRIATIGEARASGRRKKSGA